MAPTAMTFRVPELGTVRPSLWPLVVPSIRPVNSRLECQRLCAPCNVAATKNGSREGWCLWDLLSLLLNLQLLLLLLVAQSERERAKKLSRDKQTREHGRDEEGKNKRGRLRERES